MKLRTRFKRLTFWNKLGAIGSLCSIVGLLLAIGFWLWPSQPTSEYRWPEALQELADAGVNTKSDISASRTFWLLREVGSTFSLGPCPGLNCYEFKLGNVENKNGQLIQRIDVSGEGFGIRKYPDRFEFQNRITGESAGLGYVLSTGEAWIFIVLNPNSFWEISTQTADILIRIIDTRAESLRLKIEVRPGTWHRRG